MNTLKASSLEYKKCDKIVSYRSSHSLALCWQVAFAFTSTSVHDKLPPPYVA